MSRPVKPTAVVAIILAVVVVLGGGGAAAGWWFWLLPRERAVQVADAVASGLASGTLDDARLTAPAAGDLTRIYSGMGQLRPKVTVGELVDGPDGTKSAPLAWSWVIHEGKSAWEYTTTLVLHRQDGPDWKATVTPDTVAPGLLPGERLRATRLPAVRGAILGQGDAKLAWNQRAFVVGIDKTRADGPTAEASAAQLAELVGIDAERFVARVQAAGPKAFVDARVLRAGDPAEAELAAKAGRMVAVTVLDTTRPLGASSSFARPLLGVVAEATAEQVDKSVGTIRAGDLTGRGGLQEARNHVLAGTTGFVVNRADADNRTVAELFRVDAIDGSDVVTTIDAALQERAEATLAGVASASGLVAIRPSDGAILAAASGPGSQGYSTATLGQYAPGSTFKVVTTLALLRAGTTPDSTVTCSDGFTVDGYTFANWQGYPRSALGQVPLRTAFLHSCNSTFLAAAQKLGPEALADAAASLGLTAEPQLVVGAFSGRVPTDGTAVEKVAAGIGQGKVVASPLGMATVAASVAAGKTVAPVLVDEPGRPASEPVKPLTVAEAAALRDLMRGVVTGGTASGLVGLGADVTAKTGTATWGPAPSKYHGWVVVTRGDLALAVFIEDAAGGSGDAVALARSFLG